MMLPLMWRLPKYDQRVSFLFEGGGVLEVLSSSFWPYCSLRGSMFSRKQQNKQHMVPQLQLDLFPESPPLVKYISSTSNPEYILNK